ncbi:MAG: hypothetical protein K0V04_17210 [Deltaproteobacteria bacterium]|nr:hypothetical protein [Deltaproteobacteria bacterium]
MATDFELLDAWKGGDKAAGNALFQRHFDSVCRFFRSKVGEGVDGRPSSAATPTTRSSCWGWPSML